MKGLTVKVDNMPGLMKALRSLTQKQVLVGVPDSTAEREPDKDDPSPLSNAAIGYIMETGSPANNIPARPFLVPGVESAKDQITKRYSAGAKAVLSGRIASIDDVHDAVGLETASAVQAKIENGPFAPLADSTLANRKAAGRTGDKPLIDTAQLQRSITYVVRQRGG